MALPVSNSRYSCSSLLATCSSLSVARKAFSPVARSSCSNNTLPCGTYSATRATMDRRRFWDDDEIRQFLIESEEEDNVISGDSDIDCEDEEKIEVNDFNSDSEKSANENDLEAGSGCESDDDFSVFLGKDNETIWLDRPISTNTKTKQKNIIKIFPGPTILCRNTPREIDVFQKFISPEMIDKIVDYTNIYIDICKNKKDRERERDFKLTSRSEVLALFGALFIITIKKGKRANVRELWATDGTGIMFLRALFSYNRFLFLLRALRFDDIRDRKLREANDKLAAVRELHENFVRNCHQNYCMGEFTTIDEMLVPFRGRCGFVQYMPNKPAKYGIKLYALVESKMLYTWSIEIYCGKQKDGAYLVSNKPMDVVKRLVEPIKKSKRNVTTDNYYTSLPLAEFLLSHDLTLLGTLRKNKREIPLQLIEAKNRNVGTSRFGFQDEFSIASYCSKKNKIVVLLSSMHCSDEIDPESGKPVMIMDYNMTKGGVDSVDQMCSTYSTARTTRRWPMIIFFRELDIAGINSLKIFNNTQPQKEIRRRVFLKNLAFQLCKEYLENRSEIRTLPKDILLFLEQFRKTVEIKAEPSIRRGIYYICGSHKNNRTNVVCGKCNKNVCKQHSSRSVNCQMCAQSDIMETD